MATGFTFTQPGSAVPVDISQLLVSRDTVSAGNLWSCGTNTNGELGLGYASATPVVNLTMVPAGNIWKIIGDGGAMAIKTDGTLWACGYNGSERLGLAGGNKSSFTQVVVGTNKWKSVSTGNRFTVALSTDGTLWSCGYNVSWQLSTGDRTNRTTLTKSVPEMYWKSVNAGGSHRFSIKLDDDSLWSCGYNGTGQCGLGDVIQRSAPTQVPASGPWDSVVSGDRHSLALKKDGTLWACGYSNWGQTGIGGTYTFSQIAGSWKTMSAAGNTSAGIKRDGTLWTWGQNSAGGLGLNDMSQRNTPTQVLGGGTNWASISVGYYHSVAIKTDGTLWSCGYNAFGQLNLGDTANRSTFTKMPGSNNWKTVIVGFNTTFAVSSD